MKKSKNILYVLIALFITCSLCINLNIIPYEKIQATAATNNFLIQFLVLVYLSLNGFGVKYSIIFCSLVYFFRQVFKHSYCKRIKIIALLISAFGAMCVLIGNSYKQLNGIDLIFYNELQMAKALFTGGGILPYSIHCFYTYIIY